MTDLIERLRELEAQLAKVTAELDHAWNMVAKIDADGIDTIEDRRDVRTT